MLQLDGPGRPRLVAFWGVLCAAAAVAGLPVSVQHMSENNELTLPDGSTWHRGPSGNVRPRLQSNDPKSFVHPLGHNEAGSIARKYVTGVFLFHLLLGAFSTPRCPRRATIHYLHYRLLAASPRVARFVRRVALYLKIEDFQVTPLTLLESNPFLSFLVRKVRGTFSTAPSY